MPELIAERQRNGIKPTRNSRWPRTLSGVMGANVLAGRLRASGRRRRWAAIASGLGAAAALGAFAGAADGALRREPLRVLASGRFAALRGDGRRFAAVQVAADRIRLMDLARGTSRVVGIGPGACFLGGLGGGWMSVFCQDAGHNLASVEMIGVRTLARVAANGVPADPAAGEYDRDVGDSGSRWLEVTACNPEAHDTCRTEFVEWRTGERRGCADACGRRDLSSPGLAPRPYPRPRYSPLVWRAPSRPPVRLSRCRPYCANVRTVGSTVRWDEAGRSSVYFPRSGRRLDWRLPAGPAVSQVLTADGPQAVLLWAISASGRGSRVLQAKWQG